MGSSLATKDALRDFLVRQGLGPAYEEGDETIVKTRSSFRKDPNSGCEKQAFSFLGKKQSRKQALLFVPDSLPEPQLVLSGDFGCTLQHFPLSSLYNKPLHHGMGLLAEETENKNLVISLFRFISNHVSPIRKLAYAFHCPSQSPPLAPVPSGASGLYSSPYCARLLRTPPAGCWPLPECEGRSLRTVDLLLRPFPVASLQVSLVLLIPYVHDCLIKNPGPANLPGRQPFCSSAF